MVTGGMWEMGEEAMITRDINCKLLLLAVLTVDQRLQGTAFYPPIR
jgi:hypothetical protein